MPGGVVVTIYAIGWLQFREKGSTRYSGALVESDDAGLNLLPEVIGINTTFLVRILSFDQIALDVHFSFQLDPTATGYLCYEIDIIW